MNYVRVRIEECKGCGVCASVCPKKCLEKSTQLNAQGYEVVQFIEGSPCIACGLCFRCCPEPGALVVYSDKGESA